MLEFAVLGLLHETPMHGYELRKRLQEIRAFSCGTVYPTLRRMLRAGLIEEEPDEQGAQQGSRRPRRVYRLTGAGRDRFVELAEDCGPRACQDETFDVRLAFFARTPAPIRMRILESRRRRLEQRRRASARSWPEPTSSATGTRRSCTAWGWTTASSRFAGSTS